jgi:hypothetical protein
LHHSLRILSFAFLLLAACQSSPAIEADADASAPVNASDPDAGANKLVEASVPVTAFVGAFHGLDGGEANLTTQSDGTWSFSGWLCGPGGGGGGGCTSGRWQSTGTGWKLLPAADAGSTFRWEGSDVTEVDVSIVNGVLHTVSSGPSARDFASGYRCYESCESATLSSCNTPRDCR